MANTYISCFDFTLAPTGLEYGSLISNPNRIGSTGVLAGTTSVPLFSALQAVLNPYDHVTVFDGSSSETVIVSTGASVGATSVSCSAFQFSHNAGTPLCSDGVLGSLANTILSSAQHLETMCRQSLFLASYVGETLAMPTMRGAIDNQYALHFRPRHWPINSISAVALTTVPNNTTSYDPTQVLIDSDRQICSMPNMLPLPLIGSGQAPYPVWNTVSRYQSAQLTISYVAGYSIMPSDITEAAILLTSDIIAKRLNPMGAPDLGSGGRHISAVLRGDTFGQSLLHKRAKNILDNYTVQSF